MSVLDKIELIGFSFIFSLLPGLIWGLGIELYFRDWGVVAGAGYFLCMFVFLVACGWKDTEPEAEDENW